MTNKTLMKISGSVLVLFLFSVAGCTTLKPVSDLSDKAVESLEIYKEIPATYNDFCIERCQFNLIRRNQVVRDTAVSCDCRVFKSADRATTKVYHALVAYFKSLGDLSAGDLTNYDTRSLNEALTEGKFGSLTIDKNTVTAYSALGKLVMEAFTNGYRKQKLRQVIERANPNIQILLQVFKTSIGNLEMELSFQKERNFALYSELLMEKLTGYDKVRLTTDYYREIDKLTLKQQQLNTYSTGLVTIAEGHQKLFDNRNKIKANEIKEALGKYAAELQDLIVDFRKL